MKIQLIEAYYGGHHSNYIEALLPTFRAKLADGSLSQVVITITKMHFAHLQKQGISGLYKDVKGLIFDASFPEFSPAPSLKDRYQLYVAMNLAVNRVAPDALIAPSADYDVMMNALFKFKAKFGINTPVRASGIFHYGFAGEGNLSLVEKIKQFIYEAGWRHSNWQRLLMVNPLVYEAMQRKNNQFAKKLQLLPDPVPLRKNISKQAARAKLGLPKVGQLIGFVGMIDERKALPQVLEAFADQVIHTKCQLVLAGQLAPHYNDLLHSEYKSLVDTKRIILFDRYLSQDEVQLAYAAIDVVTLLQYRRVNLSANLLKAMNYDKPLIADDFGYTGMMVKRFKLGNICRVDDVVSIKGAITKSLDTFESYKPTAQTERLKAFHHTENFANTVLTSLGVAVPKDVLKSWQWVCEG